MATIGTDCHITLQHASVNSGTAAGFLLWRPDAQGAEVQVNRTGFILPTGSRDVAERYLVPIVTADTLRNPNGAKRGAVRTAEYLLYTQFLAAGSAITLAIPGHTFTGLWALGVSKERHYSTRDELDLVLTNGRVAKEVAPDLAEVVRSAGDLTLTLPYADMTGLLLSIYVPGTTYAVWLSGSVNLAGDTTADLQILLDGVSVATQHFSNTGADAVSYPVLLSVRGTGISPGAHVLKVQGRSPAEPGTQALLEGGTGTHMVARFSAINW